jgi:2-C-methyl-D-erythritol 4-phosphate cytidylyltransferase / 2-C-methyl-D-erythritol 2,4-cyclodiphosphate synthase
MIHALLDNNAQRHPWAIILAAGQSTRLQQAGAGTKKQFLPWRGVPVFWHSVRILARVPAMGGLILVFPEDDLDRASRRVSELCARECLGVPVKVVCGGRLRQDSVRCGLEALPGQCAVVLVHDAARPFLSAGLIARLLAALDEQTAGAVPGLSITDTVKQVVGDVVQATVPRETLQTVQTPQVFARDALEEAHRRCREEGWAVTDDASLLERLGKTVRIVPGEAGNIKITTPEDLRLLEGTTIMDTRLPCVGMGYDVHRFGPGRPLKLGGVPFPGAPEVIAHSDGDVLLHALADAILGCLGRGDIGELFPDTDPKLEGIDSAVLVSEVLELAFQSGIHITHVDLNIVTQVPKIAPRRDEIRRNVARLLQLEYGQVNVKAGTEEGLGFTGAKQGIKAMAVVTAMKGANGPETRPSIE